MAVGDHSPASSKTMSTSSEPASPKMAGLAQGPDIWQEHQPYSGPPVFVPMTQQSMDQMYQSMCTYQSICPMCQPMRSISNWSDSLQVGNLSTTDFMPRYPSTGQIAMKPTGSEEVVVAGPDGLAYFRRVTDHPSKPWSRPVSFPPTKGSLDASTVTGLAVHQDIDKTFRVYCVAEGKLHAFSCPGDMSTQFVVESCPAFDDFEIKSTPAVTTLSESIGENGPDRTLRWAVVVPFEHGGLLYTETRAHWEGSCDRSEPPGQLWTEASLIAEHLGDISAVAMAVTHVHKIPRLAFDPPTYIVAVCIAGGRLHSIEGLFGWPYGEDTWHDGAQDIPVHHPGGVVGNPVLLSDENKVGEYQMDLLVPSEEGGIFHFVRTTKAICEWHMIGRVSFPMGFPTVSSLACTRLGDPFPDHNSCAVGSEIRAIVQCEGQLYFIKTNESATPWVGSQLCPIHGPGPFPY